MIELENDPKQNQMVEPENDPNQNQMIESESDPNQNQMIESKQTPMSSKRTFERQPTNSNSVNQTNKSAQTIFTKDNQIRTTNFKGPKNEDPNFQMNKFRNNLIITKSSNTKSIFKFRIPNSNSNDPLIW